MKRPAGLPAIGRTTVLGLNIAKSLESTSWFGLKPRTTAAATTKPPPHVVNLSSLSTKSHDPTKLDPWEPLDACIQKNGAMDPFHTLFDQSLLNVAPVEPKDEGVASSPEPLKMASASPFEGFGVRKARHIPVAPDCVHGGARQSVHPLITPANEQVSSFTIPPSHLSEDDQMAPFSALFPPHLLSDAAEDIPQTSSDAVHIFETSPPFHLNTHSIQMPCGQIFGINVTRNKAHSLSRLNAGSLGNEDGGRASPQPSTFSRNHSEDLSDSLNSSRRSSWATSISTYREDGDSDQSSLTCADLTEEPNRNKDEIELIHEYDHYCDLIDVGNPQNCRDRDFIASLPDQKDGNEVFAAEVDSQSAAGPTISVRRDTACDCPKAPTTQAESDRQEKRPQLEASTDSEVDRRPSTPGEAVAWAHSYCDADPETAKLKILKDERGREYVLYHDCFHCVPIELAPEFADVVDGEDDGYGSATETSETARDGTKLVTILEEEDEG